MLKKANNIYFLKAVSCILVVSLIINSAFALSEAFAQDNPSYHIVITKNSDGTENVEGSTYYSRKSLSNANNRSEVVYDTAAEAAAKMKECILNREKTVVMNISADVIREVQKKYSIQYYLAFSYPYLFMRKDSNGSVEWTDYLYFAYSKWEISAKTLLNNGKDYYSVTYDIDYRMTDEQEAALDAEIENLKDELKKKNDYLTIKAIHDFILDKAEYDLDDNDGYELKFTPYGALIDGLAVCQGYAMLFYKLCMACGINVSIRSSRTHAWNQVMLDGLSYGVDCTWDDPDRLRNNEFLIEHPDVHLDTYNWFMKGNTDKFNNLHVEESIWKNYDDLNSAFPKSDTDFVCQHNCGYYYIYPEGANCEQGRFSVMKMCNFCEERIEYDIISPNSEHVYDRNVTYPTCKSGGYTTYKCIYCGSTYIDDYTEIVDHSYTVPEMIAPSTCTENEIDYMYCEYGCGERIEAEKENSALGHDYIYTAQSKNHKVTCSRCDIMYYEPCEFTQEVIAPTCTDEGETINTCIKCGYAYSSDTVNATGHDWGEYTFDNNADCVSPGTETAICLTCGATDTREYVDESFVPGEHNYVSNNDGYDATCTEDGRTDSYTCTLCDSVIKSTVINAPGHDYEVIEEYKAPTCTEEGNEEVKTCRVCGYVTERVVLPNYGGHKSKIIATDYSHHKMLCSRCQKLFYDNVTCSFQNGKCIACDNICFSVSGRIVLEEYANNSHPHNYAIMHTQIYVNDKYVTSTDDDGVFSIYNLPVGDYRIEAFNKLSRKNVTIADTFFNNETQLGDIALNIFDLDKNDKIDIIDLKAFWKKHRQKNTDCDLNNDGNVDEQDIEIFNDYLMSVPQ